jgi:hypothetical protein
MGRLSRSVPAPHVPGEVVISSETLAADAAGERLGARVHAAVPHGLGRRRRPVSANIADVQRRRRPARA